MKDTPSTRPHGALAWLRRHLRLLVIAFLLAILAGCATSALLLHQRLRRADVLEGWQEGTDGHAFTNVVYDPTRALACDIYLPLRQGPAGAMLFIHGGAWREGRRQDIAYGCRRFAKAGYVTATLSYSLHRPDDPADFHRMLDDIQACLAKLRQFAEAHGRPLSAVALSGHSAGAHLAMLYAYSRADASPIPVAFVFQQAGPADFAADAWPNFDPDFAWQLACAGAGTTIPRHEFLSGDVPAAIRDISPARLVRDATVPTIMAYGARDELVTPIHAERLQRALEQHRIEHRLILYPNSGHLLDNDPDCARDYRQAILDFARRHLDSRLPLPTQTQP
ncbi:MAG: alpha/beta hydrolase [Oligosphaeraceae bacterium]